MKWTKEQQKVIDARNKNLLVSAAAGSGKTAVLVERIIQMITEGDHPMDIDRLLVVTFTNAAAAEMRERIGIAIDEKLLQEPDNVHLQKQITLLQSARITTIHSFCLSVIRDYFHRIDLDPSFKIAEESEVTLMKSDVVSEVLERWYEEEREDFHSFIESYSYAKSDAPIEDIILNLYSFSMSAPWPKDWLKSKVEIFEISTLEELYQAPWMKELLLYLKSVIGDLLEKNKKACDICGEEGGPEAYLPAIISDRTMLEELSLLEDYGDFANVLPQMTFSRLSNKKDPNLIPEKKEAVKELRDDIKKGIKDLQSQFFFQSPEEMLSDLMAVKDVMKVLFELTIDFMDEFAKKKEEKNIIDFNDFEHFALKILVQQQDGEILPTQAALELSEQIDEILIDEYQDSNLVQETILRSISREHKGLFNRFMVGDVKQSIYKFRLAMPELFMEKYDTYSTKDVLEDGENNPTLRIDLDQNFRSRKVVLDSVNQIFEQIMVRSVGGITYDEAASLKYGGLYENSPTDVPISDSVELLLITEEGFEEKEQNWSQDGEAATGENESVEDGVEVSESDYSKRELEALGIAKKIKELVHPLTGLTIFDKKEKAYRKAQYKDIVILLRSMSGWSEVFVNTLLQEGIPAYAQTGTGYFKTVEIMTILNMLRIIDNPLQDIALVSVLYSPMVGLSSTELSLIRTMGRNISMYQATCIYMEEGQNDELREKLIRFHQHLEMYRNMATYTPIHQLIQTVLDYTKYDAYVSAMPGGAVRKANIDMLISHAIRFEKGSYSGLFHFIRYMEKLHKYDVDYGEASVTDEQDNTIRIMSIHKSKGLEFPICFVSGMSKQFNSQDLRSSIVLHNEIGVGPEYIDSKLRTKIPTLVKKVMQKKIQIENMGEELRVLYVALTRAKEKLIMTGYLKSTEQMKPKKFSFFDLISSKSYLDWVLPAILNKIDYEPEELTSEVVKSNGFVVEVLRKEELFSYEIKKQVFLRKDREELNRIDPNVIYDESLREAIYHRANYQYLYEDEANLKVKMTVTELKKLGQFIDEDMSENLYYHKVEEGLDDDFQEQELEYSLHQEKSVDIDLQEDRMDCNSSEEIIPTIPKFMREEVTEISSTDRGTLYHNVLEMIDLTKKYEYADIKGLLYEMSKTNRFREDDLQKLNASYLWKFTKSKLAKRMGKASTEGNLFKERQFVFGLKASQVVPGSSSDELILIQGIIDTFFLEDGAIVLVDYKSDYVQEEEVLVHRYQGQLHYYKKALEQMTKLPVKEMIIYSLVLGKEIRIEE